MTSPKAHAYWSMWPVSEWLRQNGVRAPYCIQRRNSSALAFPWKPPMSAPTNGCPETPKPQPMVMLSHRWSQRDWLSPIQFAAYRWMPANPARDRMKVRARHGLEQAFSRAHRHEQGVLVVVAIVRELPVAEPHRLRG